MGTFGDILFVIFMALGIGHMLYLVFGYHKELEEFYEKGRALGRKEADICQNWERFEQRINMDGYEVLLVPKKEQDNVIEVEL